MEPLHVARRRGQEHFVGRHELRHREVALDHVVPLDDEFAGDAGETA
ncbi:MAG: hypothetical protein WKF76_00630 [Nocardioidaceae bacterium]